MVTLESRKEIIISRLLTGFKYFITTLFIGEFFIYLDKILFEYKNLFDDQKYYLLGIVLSFFSLFIFKLIFLFYKIIRSKRWDIVLSILSPILLLFSINRHLLSKNIFSEFEPLRFLLILFFLLMIGSAIALITMLKALRFKPINKPFFLSDEPVETEGEDMFAMVKDAEIFAEQLLNNFSSHSVVFGLDAPWGNGKSSYINFCKKYWKQNNKIIIFEFDPLRFENNPNLLEVFIGEFLKVIKKNNYIPEVGNNLARYSKIIGSIKLGVLDFDINSLGDTTWEKAFDDLRKNLESIEKKIIVIIDDLDRIPFKDVKVVLDIVKKSFVLPNVTYLLSYDTENLNMLDVDLKITDSNTESYNTKQPPVIEARTHTFAEEKLNSAKIVEYLEKVINIKKTLVLSRGKLRDYLVKQLRESNEYFSEESVEKIVEAIDFFFAPQNFADYDQYIGNLRKIKRLLNIIKMQIIQNLDISIRDVDFIDFIYLVLIYINYPRIFRKIYLHETDGGMEFFSLKFEYSGGESRYINSEFYNKYLDTLTKQEQSLLNKIFNEDRFGEDDNKTLEDKALPHAKFTSAAFNGTIGSGKNLEAYLKLIVERKSTDVKNEFTFHLNNANKFIQGTDSIPKIFEQTEYSFTDDNNGDHYRTLFFYRLSDNKKQINYEKTKELIDYILNNLAAYSVLFDEDNEIKLRRSLTLDLVYFLDKAGWKDEEGNSNRNTKENVIEIAFKIFGEGNYSESGVLKSLADPQRGILGLHDLMSFRLYCSQDRGGQFYNLSNALAFHADPSAATAGDVRDLTIQEMREISQQCFKIFKEQYIVTSKNIFSEVYALSEQVLYSSSYGYAKKLKPDLSEEVEKNKFRLLSFIVYQLSNAKVNMGVGCGFYDETGVEDKKDIRKQINEYLFKTCFALSAENLDNAYFFINFLLLHSKRLDNFMRDTVKYVSDINELVEMFDKKMLLDYWQEHGQTIKSYLRGQKKKIVSYNYTFSYERDLPGLFDMLDKELALSTAPEPSTTIIPP